VAVRAVGSDSRALLVLLAFVTAQVLAQIPVTPGGLGFVEAGLAAMLVLAGVGAADAALATLAYRLASYWLPLPAGAAAWGIHAWRYREGPAPQGGSFSAAAADRLEQPEQDAHPVATDEPRTGEQGYG
jgi:Lysylphosphatidylglycerol synthase TM region